ncbi:MAG: DUF5622 domain-containing protein [Desulfurococcaceae archaeon]
MGLKHRKYVYVERKDGYYVKIRVLNIRFGKKIEGGDVQDPTRYIVTGVKTKKPPRSAVVVSEEVLPQQVRELVYTV